MTTHGALTPAHFTYWADSHTRMGAVCLLIWLGKLVPTVDAEPFYPQDWTPAATGAPVQLAIDTERLADVSGPWSGGERRIVAVALSLIDGDPCDLRDVMNGLGGEHLRATVQAIAYAAGMRAPGPLVLP
jgi:hypothetical protein